MAVVAVAVAAAAAEVVVVVVATAAAVGDAGVSCQYRMAVLIVHHQCLVGV